MATGRTHARIAWVLLIPLGILGSYILVVVDTRLGIGWLIGSLAGIVITPDIDLETPTYEEWRFYRIAYPLGVLWQWLWFPYAAFMAHRGLSHIYLLGTLSRLLYLLYVVIPLVIMLINAISPYVGSTYGYQAGRISIEYANAGDLFWYGLIISWSIQDAGHIFTDHHHRQASKLRQFLRRANGLAWVPAMVILILFLLLR